jgi:long-chain acyl-CoA synthetase
MNKIWLEQYPKSVPATIDVAAHASLVELLEAAFASHGQKVAYTFMGKSLTFAEVDTWSRALGAYLQSLGLRRGDRVAVMLPNVPQYPVAIAAILRAGFVVVNVNPLYTPRELEHQLKDSGAKAIVMLENFATTLQQVAAKVPTKHVIVASMGDLLGLKGLVVNTVVRRVKKLVPAFSLPGSVRFKRPGRGASHVPERRPRSGPTTSRCCSTPAAPPASARARCCCIATWWPTSCRPRPGTGRRWKIPPGQQFTVVCALPIYHIFGFTACMMLGMRMGGATS